MFKLIYSSNVYKWERHYIADSITIALSSKLEYLKDTGSTAGFYVSLVNDADIDDVQYYTLNDIMIGAASMFTTLTGLLFIISHSRQQKDFQLSILKSVDSSYDTQKPKAE